MRILIHRLRQAPRATVLSVAGDRTRLRVEGLVCDSICATRTRNALMALDGVRAVRVDFASGIADVEGTPHDSASYDRALQRAVAGGGVRRLIERILRRNA